MNCEARGLCPWILLTVAALAACEDGAFSGEDGVGSDGDVDAEADGDSDTDADSDANGDGGLDDGCSEEAKLIHVVDVFNRLYRFHPPSKEFELVGQIDCANGLGSPYALAVTRYDVVYVLYTSGLECLDVYAVSATDATCLNPTEFDCANSDFQAFGMGSATEGPGGTVDTIYVGSGTMLGRVDEDDWSITPIGPVANTPDMAGTANGELFAYFAWTDPPRVSRLDKGSAEELETVQLPQLESAGAFAFSHWGGDFYLFFDDIYGTSSRVFRLHDGTLETYMEETGLTIVGADSSTCAPVAIE